MAPLQALTAATANAAFVHGMDDSLGALEVGKRAEVLILEEAAFANVPYRPGNDPVLTTVIGGDAVP
jgi:imidazolonepropionase